MNTFFNFSANVQNAFENDENQYMSFSKLLKDAKTKVYEAGITDADAQKLIKEKFSLILGIDEKASAKEIRRAIQRNKYEIFAVIEDAIDDMLTSGWEYNTFYKQFVEVRNLALGDTNEFVVPDKTSVLSVGRLSGDHWDIDRQRLGYGSTFRVSTWWIGLGVYAEFEKVVLGREDWTYLVNKIYEAVDNYVNALVYEAVIGAAAKVMPGSTQFYKTATLDAAAKPTFVTLCEDVQAANLGANIAIIGSKAALSRLSDLVPVDWRSQEDKLDHRRMGHVGMWEGYTCIEIPQVFAKNDTTTKLVDPNTLLIMPLTDEKFVKLVYEGNSMIRETTDNVTNQDMTYEVKYMTKLGVATLIGRLFGCWVHKN